jgi:chloramphenicol-sensitive protein RarD
VSSSPSTEPAAGSVTGPDSESTPGTSVDAAGRLHPHGRHTERRVGTAAGLAAYSLWGVFPLVFRLLESVDPGEILIHRIVWSFVVVVAVLVVRRERHWFRVVRSEPGALPRLTAAAAMIATNWLVYIWAVNNDHVVEAALGYYINPLISVALGVVVLGERLRRPQVVALAFGVAAVAVLTVGYGQVPWISLVLACSFGGYGFMKKSVPVGAVTSLGVETMVLVPPALVAFAVLAREGDVAFLQGSAGRDVLLVGLGVVTAVPLLLFGTAARRIPLSLLGLLQYVTPTLQLLLGLVVFREPMPLERLVGFVLVWIALGILAADALGSRRRAPLPAPPAEAT